MANFWRILRIENQVESDVSLDCATGLVATTATIRSDSDGAVTKVTFCMDPAAPPCDPTGGALGILNGAGYTPADWDTECGF